MTAQLSLGAATRTTIEADGSSLAALQCGPLDGRPVLLLPGYTGSTEDFGPILHLVAEAGFRATTIDLPGQYESPGRSGVADYTPDALAPIVLAAARTLGTDVHLLGHSFGGFVARATVIADASPFASLVLMDSGASGVQGERRAMIEALEPVLASGGLALVYSAMQSVVARRPGYVTPPPALAAFLRRRFVAGDPVMLQGMGTAVRAEPDRVAELARAISTLPSFVLYGRDDDVWAAADLAAMARQLSCASVEIADAAHSPAVENPRATASALIDFWTSVG
jgi:pimeloyl-ACP methyl ester carboxylesterase